MNSIVYGIKAICSPVINSNLASSLLCHLVKKEKNSSRCKFGYSEGHDFKPPAIPNW